MPRSSETWKNARFASESILYVSPGQQPRQITEGESESKSSEFTSHKEKSEVHWVVVRPNVLCKIQHRCNNCHYTRNSHYFIMINNCLSKFVL